MFKSVKYVCIGFCILFCIGSMFCIAFSSNPEGKIINDKGYKSSGQNTYFWLVIDGSTYDVNYDIWRLNVVGKPFTKTVSN